MNNRLYLSTVAFLLFSISSFATYNHSHLEDSLVLLKNKIEMLPSNNSSEIFKKTFLRFSVQMAVSINKQNRGEEASTLLAEIAKAIPVPANKLQIKENAPYISSLRKVLTPINNPYIESMCKWMGEDLNQYPAEWQAPDLSSSVETKKLYAGARTKSSRMQAHLWALVNPASPIKGNDKLLSALLFGLYDYVQYILHTGTTVKAGSEIYDDFAIAPAVCVFREFAVLFDDYLLPSQKRQIDSAMRITGEVMYQKAGPRKGVYANIDLSEATQLLNIGLHLNSETYISKAKFLVHAQWKNLYTDGAIAYIGTQNESTFYHDSDVRDLANYYKILGDSDSYNLLKATEWYGPVSSGRLGEFWTVPSWKGTWNNNSGAACGMEVVAGITGNPYLRWQLDFLKAKNKEDKRHWENMIWEIPWYRNDVTPKALPENYTIYDRNMQGPRAWYGHWNYATTLRNPSDSEAGLATIYGAQTVSNKFKLNASVMGVYPRVRVKENVLTKEGVENRSAWAWLTSDMKNAVAMANNAAAFAADYQLHTYGSSQKGPKVDWLGKQLWITLPDRCIGFLQIQPKTNDAVAYEVNGVVRLSFGGTEVAEIPKKLEQLSNTQFKYGDIIVNILSNNYAGIKQQEVPFRLPKAPISEIVLQDEKAVSNQNTKIKYPITSKYSYMVEIKPEWTKADAIISQLIEKDSVLSFEVQLDNEKYIVWYNTADKGVAISPTASALKNIPNSLHLSNGDESVAALFPAPKNYQLPPHKVAFLICGKDKSLHQKAPSSLKEFLMGLEEKGKYNIIKF